MDQQESRAIELIKKMLAVHDSDIDCEVCGEQMDCLAELALAGQKPEGALEAIQRHIECCHCCAYEFETLLAVLRADQAAAER